MARSRLGSSTINRGRSQYSETGHGLPSRPSARTNTDKPFKNSMTFRVIREIRVQNALFVGSNNRPRLSAVLPVRVSRIEIEKGNLFPGDLARPPALVVVYAERRFPQFEQFDAEDFRYSRVPQHGRARWEFLGRKSHCPG